MGEGLAELAGEGKGGRRKVALGALAICREGNGTQVSTT